MAAGSCGRSSHERTAWTSWRRRRAPLIASWRYPSAVIPDLLAFLAWSTRSGDVEYETANFLYWSKRGMDEGSAQLGFGVCAPGEMHGDVEYYYVVEHDRAQTTIVAHRIEPTEHGPRVGEIVRRVAVPQEVRFLSPRDSTSLRD